MPEFNDDILNNFIKKNEENAQVLVLSRLHLTNVALSESIELSSCSYLNLSYNDFQDICNLWQFFPELWWINLSHNSLSSLKSSFVSMPSAFGLLDLSYNNLTLNDLIGLHSIQILRLKLPKTILESTEDNITEKEARKQILSYLPYIWSFNDDFITVQEKEKIKYKSEDIFINSNEWENKSVGDRVGRFLHICQVFPTSGPLADTIRLDILLEDYLELARVNNLHSHLSKSSFKRMPSIDIITIMSIPHRVRIDLSVMLTTSILFDIPLTLFNDAIILLLNGHMNITDIQDIPYLPLFARTALVNIIRRICFRELKEIQELGFNLPKILHSDYPDCIFKTKGKDPILPTFLDTSGFNHLRPLKIFLNRPIEYAFTTLNNASNVPKSIEFSALENELLKYLPNCPTKFNVPDVNTTDYRSWVSLACRHTVLLFVKCPSCPTLTRGQNNKVSQDLYRELLPILTAAGMIYSDLELITTGPSADGRLAPVTNKLNKEMTNAMIGGHVLSYGQGLPAGGCENLSWNDPAFKRPYHNLSTWEEYSQEHSKSNVVSVVSAYDNQNQYQTKSFFSDKIDLNSDVCIKNPNSNNNKTMSAHINALGSGLIQTINDSKPSSPLRSRPTSPSHFRNGQVISPNRLTQGTDLMPELVRPLHSQPNSSLHKDPQHYWESKIPNTNSSNKKYNQIEKKQYLKSYTDTGIYKNNKLGIKPVIMNPVGIFSADCNWESSFLVAPKIAIEDHNMRLQDKFQHWEVIEKPPVMIHPLGGGDVDIDERKLLSLTAHFNTNNIDFMNEIPNDSRMSTSDKPILTDTITDNNISSLSETNNAIKPILEVEQSQTSQKSKPKSIRIDNNNNNNNNNNKAKFQPSNSETVPDATRRLLAEMGTLRNMREINKHKNRETYTNDILEEVEIQKIPKQVEVGSRPQSNGSRTVSRNVDRSILINPFDSSKLTASRSKAVFGVPEYGDSYPMDKPDYKKIEKEKEDNVFLTGVNICETEQMEESTIDKLSLSTPSILVSCPEVSMVTMEQSIDQAFIEPSYTLTAKEVLSLKLNYDKVYSNTQGIEYAYTTKGGAAISNIKYFYPVNEKIVYTLDKNSVNMAIHNTQLLPPKQIVKNVVNLRLNNQSVTSIATSQNISRNNSSREAVILIPNASNDDNVDNNCLENQSIIECQRSLHDEVLDESKFTKYNDDDEIKNDNNNFKFDPSDHNTLGGHSIGSLSSGGSSATRTKKTNKAIDELVKELNADSFVSKKKNDNYLKFISKQAFDGYRDNNDTIDKNLETDRSNNIFFDSQISDSRILDELNSNVVQERQIVDGYSIITSPQFESTNFNITAPPSPSKIIFKEELSYDVNRPPPIYMETTVKKVYTLDPFSTNGEDTDHNNQLNKKNNNFINMTDELSSCGISVDSIQTSNAMIDHILINNKSTHVLKKNNVMSQSLPFLNRESMKPNLVNISNIGLEQNSVSSKDSPQSDYTFLAKNMPSYPTILRTKTRIHKKASNNLLLNPSYKVKSLNCKANKGEIILPAFPKEYDSKYGPPVTSNVQFNSKNNSFLPISLSSLYKFSDN